jgi:phospholipid/cholesterol/gamma-HCH transport system permease protein
MKLLYHIGRYVQLMLRVFQKPEKQSIYLRQIVIEMDKLGINSLGIVIIISFFLGAVITMQTAYNFENPLIPLYLIGLTTRDSMLLEFSSTIVGLILAGKVGSNIASEIGAMRVTEQIDALEIMGINSAAYLIFPKIIATLIINPLLTIVSMFVGIFGGYLSVFTITKLTVADYFYGLHYALNTFYITYAIVKTIVFAFIITSVPAYYGYYVEGGSLEVGKNSTAAVVYSSILILLFNMIITQILLT